MVVDVPGDALGAESAEEEADEVVDALFLDRWIWEISTSLS